MKSSDKYEKEYFTNIIKNSLNFTDACINLGNKTTKGNRDTIKKYILKYNLNISHFHRPKQEHIYNKLSLNDILVVDSTYIYSTTLKKRLFKEKILEPICLECGQDENWRGKKISLIIDHINGVNNDNRIENLRILCPNCNATLSTNGGKNIKIKYPPKKKEKKLNTYKPKRKIENRPTKEQLELDIREFGYRGTGRKYGVSDTSIRNWLK